jgi:hypothetical protein
MNPHEPFDEMAAALALDALDPADRRAFEEHLATCARCQAAVTDLRRVAAGIGLSVDPVDLPAGLKSKVLAAVVSQPQVRAFSRLRVRETRTRSMAPWLALAAGLALATLGGSYGWRAQQESVRVRAEAERAQTDARARVAALEERLAVMGAPDVVQVPLQGQPDAPGSTARVFMSKTRGMVLNAEHLPALPAGRVYQLWVVTKQAPVSIGVFSVGADGSAQGVMPVPAEATRDPVAVAVTIEPAGGVLSPTGPKVLVGTVAPQ